MHKLRPARLAQQAQGVRGRSAAFAALAVLVVLAVGAVAMLWLFRAQLTQALDDSLTQASTGRAELLEQGVDPQTVAAPGADTSFVWIGHSDGTTVAVNGEYLPAETFVPPDDGTVTEQELLVTELEYSFDDNSGESSQDEIETEHQTMRLAATSTTLGLTVVTAAETESIDETLSQLGGLFLLAVPAMSLVVLGLSWFTVGRALGPVDQIRREAAVIGGEDLSRRVPVPGANDEIQQLALTMNTMLDRLETHDERLRRFTADASHELKSPVANIRILLETQVIDDPGWSELQERLQSELERLRALIDNLLYLARHDEYQTTGATLAGSRTTRVALDDLLFAEAELLAATTDLRVDISGVGPAFLSGSRSDLQRLFRNLSDNAARHASTTVKFRCRQDEHATTIIEVIDDGPGIPAEDHERIFERFTRLDHGRGRDIGGTGLGLAIVKAVAQNHGATVSVADVAPSAPGQPNGPTGARFTVTFQ